MKILHVCHQQQQEALLNDATITTSSNDNHNNNKLKVIVDDYRTDGQGVIKINYQENNVTNNTTPKRKLQKKN